MMHVSYKKTYTSGMCACVRVCVCACVRVCVCACACVRSSECVMTENKICKTNVGFEKFESTSVLDNNLTKALV